MYRPDRRAFVERILTARPNPSREEIREANDLLAPWLEDRMVADRIIQLDHQTRGRIMFGAGPGLLPSDAFMLGIDPSDQREMMAQSLDVILRLMAGETVTEKTEWFNLQNARCQLLPYTKPRPEVAVASTITPSGGRLAGKYGLGMLCVAATQARGFDALATNWQIACERAAERGETMDRKDLRVVGPMHLAETREQAIENVKFGIRKFTKYFGTINPTAAGQDMSDSDPTEGMIKSGRAVIGTPEDAIEQIERLQKQTGGFGAFLHLGHNWANFENTKKSYELFARHVMPHFHRASEHRADSMRWAMDNSKEFMSAAISAAQQMFQKHAKEEAERKSES